MNALTLVQFQHYPSSVPLGALYLAYGLERENVQFDLNIYPHYNLGAEIDKLYTFLAKSRKIIAIGCWSHTLPYLLVVLEKIKRRFPEKVIILGGIGPTEVAEEIMKKFKFIDFIIKGCGILPLPKLVKKIIKGDKVLSDISGLVYRNDRDIICSNYNSFYFNSIVSDLLPYHRIRNIHSYREFNIKTSVGCLYKCTYCQIASFSKGKVIYRNLNKVMEEIKFIKKLKKNKNFIIALTDNLFVIDRRRVIKFCNLLTKEKLNVQWMCSSRVDRMDEELLKIMSKNGCKKIYYGIESGSNRILKKIKKNFTIEAAIKLVLLSKKYIPEIIVSFMYQYPFETQKDFIDTFMVKTYLESKGISTQLHSLTPIKNSEIYIKYRKNLYLFRDLPNTSHEKLDSMPKECVRLIEDNPDIFYFYYSYKVKD